MAAAVLHAMAIAAADPALRPRHGGRGLLAGFGPGFAMLRGRFASSTTRPRPSCSSPPRRNRSRLAPCPVRRTAAPAAAAGRPGHWLLSRRGVARPAAGAVKTGRAAERRLLPAGRAGPCRRGFVGTRPGGPSCAP